MSVYNFFFFGMGEFYDPLKLLRETTLKVNEELVLLKQSQENIRLQSHVCWKLKTLHTLVLEIEEVRKKLQTINRENRIEPMDIN